MISGASKGGEQGVATGAYERMCDAGVLPTPVTFSSLMELLLAGGERPLEEVSWAGWLAGWQTSLKEDLKREPRLRWLR